MISRRISRPTRRKKIASRPSENHSPMVNEKAPAGGPTANSAVMKLWYSDASGVLAQMTAAAAAMRSARPPDAGKLAKLFAERCSRVATGSCSVSNIE